MAIKLITTIQNFQGLSTDAWPTSPPEGSILHLVDTGEAYVYYDGTWEQDLRRITALQTV